MEREEKKIRSFKEILDNLRYKDPSITLIINIWSLFNRFGTKKKKRIFVNYLRIPNFSKAQSKKKNAINISHIVVLKLGAISIENLGKKRIVIGQSYLYSIEIIYYERGTENIVP